MLPHLQPAPKIRLLIVPGHDDQYSGTEFRNVREADLTLQLGLDLYARIKNDPRFDVIITRDANGYTPVFQNYFDQNREAILTYAGQKALEMASGIASGTIQKVSGAYHNTVNTDIAVRLYGINKWASENNIDLVLHVHFNDTASRPKDNPGPYHGLTVYIPDSQYGNASTSQAWGKALYDVLSPLYPASTEPQESAGLVPDQDLIAIGSNNSLSSASALIEYGYIYEPQFLDPTIRNAVIDDMAYHTLVGIHAFFGDSTTTKIKYNTPLLPNTWSKTIAPNTRANLDILSLQAALRSVGLYPVKGMDTSNCRMSGNFDPCTTLALKSFQRKYKISPTGTLGPVTRAKLNKIFSY